MFNPQSPRHRLQIAAAMFQSLGIVINPNWVLNHYALRWALDDVEKLATKGTAICRRATRGGLMFRRSPALIEMNEIVNYLLLCELLMIEGLDRQSDSWRKTSELHSTLCEAIGRFRERHLPRAEVLMAAIHNAVLGLRCIML